jgi:hypothetical protein
MGMKTRGSTRWFLSQARYSSAHLLEAGLAVVFEVELVHHTANLANAQEVEEVTMTARVFLDALGGRQ